MTRIKQRIISIVAALIVFVVVMFAASTLLVVRFYDRKKGLCRGFWCGGVAR